MKIGIIGAGLQAKRRGPYILQSKNCELVSITSDPIGMAQNLSKELGCRVENTWMEMLESGIDAVMVLTTPDSHAKISIEAMKRGIHVFCEKPIANTLQDAKEMLKVKEEKDVVLKIGFNHRYHPAIREIKKWIEEGKIGEIKFIRSVYGIGARPGIKDEWRSNPSVVAGGQLFEQGIHCIDLMRWFVGNPSEVVSLSSSPYSMIEPLEDNTFTTFKTSKGQLINIHSSILQWKNHFSFEVFGSDGYATATGLGGSYGIEKAILGKRDSYGPFAEYVVEYRGQDQSWQLEWQDFENSIKNKTEPLGNGMDGYESIRLVFAAYQSQKEGKVIKLN